MAEGNGFTTKEWNTIKEEYNYLCAYCGQMKPLTIDHIVPLSKGGRHDIDNIVPACGSCNSSKGNSNILEFLYRRRYDFFYI
jgi:5-methylcytosine-specific restriction endonuclease McrA